MNIQVCLRVSTQYIFNWFYSLGDFFQFILGLIFHNIIIGLNKNEYIHLPSRINSSCQNCWISDVLWSQWGQDWHLRKVYFVVFGFLALSSVILFEFYRIFLTWVNMVPEIFLHLGIQVKINIANCEEGVMGPGCWALKRKAAQ